MSFVYWVYDESCSSTFDTGYIGVSEDPSCRWAKLRSAGITPKIVGLACLFEGTREECLEMEYQLRPRKNIGWNKAAGDIATAKLKHGRKALFGDGYLAIRDTWDRYDADTPN
jgi:hypothetical protein